MEHAARDSASPPAPTDYCCLPASQPQTQHLGRPSADSCRNSMSGGGGDRWGKRARSERVREMDSGPALVKEYGTSNCNVASVLSEIELT